MPKPKPAWLSILPAGLDTSSFSLDELRVAKQVHGYLTERIEGPEGIAYFIRGFRFLLYYGLACIAEDRYPPLTRRWKHLQKLFRGDPAFEDDIFIPSWILMDFPFGPERQTTLDRFEAFVEGTEAGRDLQRFIAEARKSRLGLHQDVLRTKKLAKFRELFTGRVIEAFPSVDAYETGEILLTRTLAYGDQIFMFGDPKGFPKAMKREIEDMVSRKLFYFAEEKTPLARYEAFMKLAGPYWMSCVTKNHAVPILEPDHYLTYFDRRA